MAKKQYVCFDCGKTFDKQYKLMLHYDFHKGEPVVRAAGCFCGQDWDIRCGKCLHCGHVHNNGWALTK